MPIKIKTGYTPPILLAIQVMNPTVNVVCQFKTRCKGTLIKKKDYGMQFLSANGKGESDSVHWACIPCGQKAAYKHLRNLAKAQGWLMDAINKASAIEYGKTQKLKDWKGMQERARKVHLKGEDEE